MRKRSGRQSRFAAVPNETIDDAGQLDLAALGLLTVLLRHRDGWDITLADIGKRYGYGEDAMAAAMGLLQVARYVVKIRIMDTRGLWSTEVVVYDTPASDEEVAALVADLREGADVRQVQVIQPTQTAAARAAKRQAKLGRGRGHRLREFPESVATCENSEKSQVATDSGVNRDSVNPRVSKKTVSKNTKNTSASSSLLRDVTPQQPGEHRYEEEEVISKETPNPNPEAVAWVLELPWRHQPGAGQRDRMAALVAQAWAKGWTSANLRRALTAELGSAQSLYAVWMSRLTELRDPPVAAPATSSAAAPVCPTHPSASRRADGQCGGCWADRLTTETDRRLLATGT